MESEVSNEQIILRNARRFFEENPHYITILYNINAGKSKLSLRLIDWFLTNYTREFETYIDEENYRDKGVYKMYRNKLKKFNKKYFDTFCRGDRIILPQHNRNEEPLETTIGQLNLFYWLFSEGILELVIKHREDVTQHMAHHTKKGASLPIQLGTKPKKRKEITKSSSTLSIRRRLKPLHVNPNNTNNANSLRYANSLRSFESDASQSNQDDTDEE